MRFLRRFVHLPQLIPCLIEAGEKTQQSWGRLLHLSARGLTLLTRMELRRGQEIFLTFELAGATLFEVACRVVRSTTDQDGYLNYGLALEREKDVQLLKDRLLELLAKKP